MQQNLAKFFEWTPKCSTEKACLEVLNRCCWKNGFICPKSGHDKSWQLKHRHVHTCDRQVSPRAGTVFEHTRLPLPKWFATIYLMGADKGRNSAQQILKMIDMSWPTAYRMLTNLCQSMGERNRDYWLEEFVKVDDAYVGAAIRAREDAESWAKFR